MELIEYEDLEGMLRNAAIPEEEIRPYPTRELGTRRSFSRCRSSQNFVRVEAKKMRRGALLALLLLLGMTFAPSAGWANCTPSERRQMGEFWDE